MTDQVAIVAMSALGALGTSVRGIVEQMRADAVGIRPPAALEQLPKSCRNAGEVPMQPVSDGGLFRAEQLLRSALEDVAGAGRPCVLSSDPARNAVVVGTTVGGMRHCGAAMRAQCAGDEAAAMQHYCMIPASTVLRRATRGMRISGPMITVSCACASGLSALAHGCALLRSGSADAVIAGGYDPMSEFVYGGFSALQLIAEGPLRPFAADRDGMKVGEGCALFVLRRAVDASRDGLPVLGVIDGIGESSDAHHLTHPHPEGRGAATALRQATEVLGRRMPDLLLAHATGTPGNDAAEFKAYVEAFGTRLHEVPVAALKSRLGHPLAAAGALELAIAIESRRQGIVPSGSGPEPDAESFPSLRLLRGVPQPGTPARVTCLAAGFGGANVAVTVSDPGTASPRQDVAATVGASILGWGMVCPAGAGPSGVAAFSAAGASIIGDDVLARYVDRARYRRVAALPRMMIAAVRNLAESVGTDDDFLRSTPVLCATWHGAVDFTERYYRDLIESGVDLANPLLFAESVPNIGSGHVSMALGITAPCASVIGSRNSGLEAMALACARIESGAWDRAIVVASDEAHPLLDAVLSHWSGQSIRSVPSAVAVLVGSSRSGGRPVRAVPGGCAAGAFVSSSLMDRDLRGIFTETAIPECGAATPLAVAMAAVTAGTGRFPAVHSAEPGGTPWALEFHA